MPSRIIHYVIANEIMKKKKIDSNMFILGNLSPDAHGGTDEESNITHFRIPKEKRNMDYIDIISFEEKYMQSEIDDFILGYYCHLITDNNWLKKMYRKYVRTSSAEEEAKRVQICYEDYRLLNCRLIEYFDLEQIDIHIPAKIKITEINIDLLAGLLNKFNGDFIYKNESQPLSILKFDIILEFINDAVELCLRNIENYI